MVSNRVRVEAAGTVITCSTRLFDVTIYQVICCFTERCVITHTNVYNIPFTTINTWYSYRSRHYDMADFFYTCSNDALSENKSL